MCQFPGLANRNRYITVSRIRDCSNAYRESLGCVRLEVEAVVGAGEGAGHGRPTSSLSPGLLVLRVLDETLGPVSLGYHQLPCRRERVGEILLQLTRTSETEVRECNFLRMRTYTSQDVFVCACANCTSSAPNTPLYCV